MGLKLEMKDVQVESLIPPGLDKGTADDFLAKLPQFDGEMKKRFDAAAAKGKVLRYMGRLTADGKAVVGVFYFSSRRRHTNWNCDWSSDVCSSDLVASAQGRSPCRGRAPLRARRRARAARLDDPAGIASHPRHRSDGERGVPRALAGRHPDLPGREIGRASCRERVWKSMVRVCIVN